MKKILFRADAKPSIGTGDLMSLITLSEYLSDFECFFLTQDTPAAKGMVGCRMLKNVIWISENASIEEDVAAINAALDKYAIGILFFEITERKLTEYIGLKNGVSKLCVNFDGVIPDDMKLVINWDAAADKYYDTNSLLNTTFLLGPKYVILPKAFYSDDIKKREYTQDRKKILIAMGGADELDFTLQVAEAVVGKDRELTVVVGAGYNQIERLRNSLDAKGANYKIKINVSDMLTEYLSCDFAIGAGGLTSSELVASRTPCALMATYEHQIARCEYFDREGWAKYLGFRSCDGKLLDTVISQFSPKLGENIFNTIGLAYAVRKI